MFLRSTLMPHVTVSLENKTICFGMHRVYVILQIIRREGNTLYIGQHANSLFCIIYYIDINISMQQSIIST